MQVKIELMKVFPQNNTAVRSEDDGIERMIIKKENVSCILNIILFQIKFLNMHQNNVQ